ncbi:MAG: crossover junction endodeoxyribonuclease RuvC [Clostridia bacterium]|nr:crossover junction endodeoxyribonuclease RuvC [Clostridia bacterium]
MIILGIDPGVGIVGYGVLSCGRGTGRGHVSSLGHGVITTPPNSELCLRLEEIYTDMLAIIDKFKPDAAAVEELFFVNNTTTGIPVAQARGVILLALTQKKIPVYEYTPLQVKTTMTGYGKATKKQMMEQVTMRLGLSEVPHPDDAADALAIALCHAFTAASGITSVRRGI